MCENTLLTMKIFLSFSNNKLKSFLNENRVRNSKK